MTLILPVEKAIASELLDVQLNMRIASVRTEGRELIASEFRFRMATTALTMF